MRTTSLLKTTALVIAAVVLGLGTVQGSLAVWNTTTVASAGTIQSADFAVMLKPESGTTQRLNANGKPAAVELPPITGLMPNEPRTVEVAVTNATAAGNGNFRIKITAATPTVTGPTDIDVAAGFTASGTCTTTTRAASIHLADGASATLCVTVSLEKGAPATASGQANKINVDITAAQL